MMRKSKYIEVIIITSINVETWPVGELVCLKISGMFCIMS